MRLKIELKANNNVSQKHFLTKYHNAMNSYIYNILTAKEKFKNLHDEKTIKGFCFSNVHPVREGKIKENENYRIIISSAVPSIIEALFFGIKNDSLMELGDASFTVTSVSVEGRKLDNNSTIETPIFIHITKKEDGKPLLFNNEKERFLKQLQNNLLHKHNKLNNDKIEMNNLFENVEIDKVLDKYEYSAPLQFEHGQYNVIGNKLYFKFNNITDEQLKVFQTCFDAGFGEKCQYGFGFMVKK